MHNRVIDWVSLQEQEVVQSQIEEIGITLCNKGYFVVTNPPIDQSLQQKIIQIEHELFDLSLEIKNKHNAEINNGRSGYIPFMQELSNPHFEPDPKEVWHISKESLVPMNWPNELQKYKQNIQAYQNQLDIFSSKLMEIISKFLNCEKYIFEIMECSNSVIRFIRYQQTTDQKKFDTLSGEHKDVTLITLHTYSSLGGLEVLNENKMWEQIDAVDGSVVINAGTMLEHISGGRMKAPLHRVKNLINSEKNREFIGYFVHPNVNAIIKNHSSLSQKNQYEDIHNMEMLIRRTRDIKII